jgi:hypothetical protein
VKSFKNVLTQVIGTMAVLAVLIPSGYAQDNSSSKRAGGKTPPPVEASALVDSLFPSQGSLGVGDSEAIVAVAKNLSTSAVTIEVNTQILLPENNSGPVIFSQINTVSVPAGMSFTQTFPFTPTVDGTYRVTTVFSVNGVITDTKTSSFQVFTF